MEEHLWGHNRTRIGNKDGQEGEGENQQIAKDSEKSWS